MPWIIYLKNDETGKYATIETVYYDEKIMKREKSKAERILKHRNLSFISVHEKKIK